MHKSLMRISLFSMLAVAGTVFVGCANNSDGHGAQQKGQAGDTTRKGETMIKEGKQIEKHGEALKAQGDETGGTRLIEQGEVKKEEGKVLIEQNQKPKQ